MFDRFLEAFPPEQVTPVGEETLARYRDVVPAPLLELWRSHGWGSYGAGLLWLVDPTEYQPTLNAWLINPDEETRTPFLRSAFSHLFYYRSEGSVQFLDPHNKVTDFVGTDVAEFFNDFLTAPDVREDVLWETLFTEARALRGPVASTEMYAFVPALCLGGAFTAASLDVVDLAVHNSILIQS